MNEVELKVSRGDKPDAKAVALSDPAAPAAPALPALSTNPTVNGSFHYRTFSSNPLFASTGLLLALTAIVALTGALPEASPAALAGLIAVTGANAAFEYWTALCRARFDAMITRPYLLSTTWRRSSIGGLMMPSVEGVAATVCLPETK